MICISIAQESRRMALVDMLNASRQCDLLEVQLDRFENAPDVGELLEHKPKPVIFSCRRKQDGGNWNGSEEERQAILRQCIVAKADYVEIELDIADQIRRFPPAKRVITYTNRHETPSDLADIYAQAQTKSPDVIKLVTQARTPEEAWPLLQILAKPALPTVVVGLGKAGVMLSVLGQRIGAPWTYAALEKGMEAYTDQPTVRELHEIYHFTTIEKGTRFVGVTGSGRTDLAAVAMLNGAFSHSQLPIRSLPLGVGSVPLFRKVIDAVKLQGVVIDAENRSPLVGIAGKLDADAESSRSIDLLLRTDSGWVGHNTLARSLIGALEAAMRAKAPSEHPLQGRMVMIAGTTGLARAIGEGIAQRGGMLTVASGTKEAGQQLAQALNCRHVLWEGLYTSMHDVLVVAEESKLPAKRPGDRPGLHSGYLKPSMAILDLTGNGDLTAFARDAQLRGCAVVSPRHMLQAQIEAQARLLTGKETPTEVLARAMEQAWPAEE